MPSPIKQTPLMRQFDQIKSKYPDAMLLFRVGDFYETFGEDAIKAAQILNITLTRRNNGTAHDELAGFPHHALNTYLPKLVKAGLRVAVCDQLEDPKKTKTIVKRGITELVTPGVVFNDSILESKSNNFLCALHFGKNQTGIAFLDASTGEFLVGQGAIEYIDKLLQNFSPVEVLVAKTQKQTYHHLFKTLYHAFFMEDWAFKPDFARETLQRQFEVSSLKGFGIEDLDEGIVAAGVAMHYLSDTQQGKALHVNHIARIADSEYVWMDRFTIRNLELFSGNNNGSSLLEVIDQTLTPMGGRLLRRRLALPLKNADCIRASLESVSFLAEKKDLLPALKASLGGFSDLERLASKIAAGKISPREVVRLKESLAEIHQIKTLLASAAGSLQGLCEKLDPCDSVCAGIQKRLIDDAPISIQKGGAIAEGFSEELDDLRALKYSGKDYLEKMLQREIDRTGIASLKIGVNNVFGYYFEVRNAHKDKAPEDWIRKQTTTNTERYVSQELKDYETKIFTAEEQIAALEQQLFAELIESLLPHLTLFKANARLIAEIDLLYSFAKISLENRYCRPTINNSHHIIIRKGRHPVIEKQLPEGTAYVANDVLLNRDNQQIMMITGPNMSGKSALLRQTALIVLMAQMGCFVPAESAEIGVVDKIFTRVGAGDNISMGESTFMLEMNEAASILNNLSDRSLILLDELGRGTSTYDGVSIAWAVTEYLALHPFHPKTLFATHYHELNEMASLHPNIKNFNVSVKEVDNKVLFIRTLKEGGSHHSFGIHVARMAGLPPEVIQKSEQILKQLEASHVGEKLETRLKSMSNKEMQLSLFSPPRKEPLNPVLETLRQELAALDLNAITPMEALFKISEWKNKLTRSNP